MTKTKKPQASSVAALALVALAAIVLVGYLVADAGQKNHAANRARRAAIEEVAAIASDLDRRLALGRADIGYARLLAVHALRAIERLPHSRGLEIARAHLTVSRDHATTAVAIVENIERAAAALRAE